MGWDSNPRRAINPCRFSRPVPSTARPPIRESRDDRIREYRQDLNRDAANTVQEVFKPEKNDLLGKHGVSYATWDLPLHAGIDEPDAVIFLRCPDVIFLQHA